LPSEYGPAWANTSSSTPPTPNCCSKTNGTPGGRYPKTPLLAPLAGPAVADDLDGCWWAIELDGTGHDRAVRTSDTPPADCPALAALAVVHHDLADQWLEEEQPVYGMPKNPYHRVDALASGPSLTGPAEVTTSALAQRLIDEGLRMADHPGVIFKDGRPAAGLPSPTGQISGKSSNSCVKSTSAAQPR